MKQITSLLLLVILFFSCSDDTQESLSSGLNIQIISSPIETDYSNFLVTLIEKESRVKTIGRVTKNGIATFKLPQGVYTITAEDLIDNSITRGGSISDYEFNGQIADIKIEVSTVINATNKYLVLDELYFNGAMNNWLKSQYDQYFTIRNISNRALYVDGLSFGITADYNTFYQNDEMSQYLPNHVVVSQLYSLPGDGKEYRLEPNQSIVIAFSAQNHKENGRQPNSLDLTGADFEVFMQGGPTTDNLEVPNVIVNFANTSYFKWVNSGATPLVLCNIEEPMEDFIESNSVKLANMATLGNQVEEFIKIPTQYIIDGVETGLADGFSRKVLPNEIDKGAILIDDDIFGGFKAQFIQRKPILDEQGNSTIQSTGNSLDDFILNAGKQKSYPKK